MRWVAVVALIGLGMLFGVGPAGAGGPTSALVAVPGEGWAAGLYHDDSDYVELQSLLDAGEVVDGEIGWDEGDHLTVTWLVHDVEVWRTDRVLLGASGGPVVETTMRMEGVEPVVRRVADPDRLVALVAGVRVEPVAQRTPLPVGEPEGDVRWVWGVGGVVVGVLAAVVVGRVRASR